MIVAGIDVGGTGVKSGLVDEGHEVTARAKDPTPQNGPHALVTLIAKQIRGFKEKPAAVGVGIPGAVSGGEIIHVPNLPNWSPDFDFRKTLEKALGVPVALGNDVNVGLLGEWLAGAAKGAKNVLGVWMGTGVGGALILDGRPYDGVRGAAGEIGHVVVRADGALCSCGRRGCVEAYAGRRMMTETVRAMQAAGRRTSLFKIEDKEDKTRPTSKVWAEALDEGDPVATEVFDGAIEAVGLGIGSVLNVLDLERVVIGGGFGERMGKKLAERIGAVAQRRVMAPNPKLKYVASELGDASGIVGAAALARALLVKG